MSRPESLKKDPIWISPTLLALLLQELPDQPWRRIRRGVNPGLPTLTSEFDAHVPGCSASTAASSRGRRHLLGVGISGEHDGRSGLSNACWTSESMGSYSWEADDNVLAVGGSLIGEERWPPCLMLEKLWDLRDFLKDSISRGIKNFQLNQIKIWCMGEVSRLICWSAASTM